MDDIGEAVYFLKETLMDNGPMTAHRLVGYLSHTSEDLRRAAGSNPEGLTDFVELHSTAFHISRKGKIHVKAIEENPQEEAQLFLLDVLKTEGGMHIKSLVGHLGNACSAIRSAAGRNEDGLTNFISNYPHLFHMSGAFVQRTTKAFIDTIGIPLSTDGHMVTLIVLDMFLRNGIHDASIADVHSELCNGVEWNDEIIDYRDLKMALCKWPFFFVKNSDVSLRKEKLTNQCILELYISALFERDGCLSLEELFQKVRVFQLTKSIGVENADGLLDIMKKKRFMKLENYFGLYDSSVMQTLESLVDIIKSRDVLLIQNITGYLSQMSEDVREVLGSEKDLHSFLKRHKNIFCVQGPYVSLQSKRGKNSVVKIVTASQVNYRSSKTTPDYHFNQKQELDVVRQSVIQLITHGELAIIDLFSTLKQIITDKCIKVASEKSLLEIFTKYGIFEIGKSSVCLKVEPEEGYVFQICSPCSVINKRGSSQKVFYEESAVYIPPQAHISNELDYLLKVKSPVRYIAVDMSKTHLRAVVVWPSKSATLAAQMEHNFPLFLDTNTSVGRSRCIESHLALLKNVVLLLLSCGSMTIIKLYEALQKVMSAGLHLPRGEKDLHQLLSNYEIFSFSENSVVLNVEPMEGRISKCVSNFGFITNTPDQNGVFYKHSDLYSSPEEPISVENYNLKVNTKVKFIAVKVSSLPAKVEGNRVSPLRGVLVWAKGGPSPNQRNVTKVSSESLHFPSVGDDRSRNQFPNRSLSSLSIMILKEVVLHLLSARRMSLNDMFHILHDALQDKLWEIIRSEMDLRFFLSMYNEFYVTDKDVTITAVAVEGHVEYLTASNLAVTGGVIHGPGELTNVCFDRLALADESEGVFPNVGNHVNYIAVSILHKSDIDGLLPRTAVLVWAKNRPCQGKLAPRDVPRIAGCPIVYNPKREVDLLVSLIMTISNLECRSATSIPICQETYSLASDILKDCVLCRMLAMFYPSLLKLSDDGLSLSLSGTPPTGNFSFELNARVASVEPNFAIAVSSNGKIFIDRGRFLPCRVSHMENLEVPKDGMESILKVEDEVSCLVVACYLHSQLHLSSPMQQAMWQAILAWTGSCNVSKVMLSPFSETQYLEDSLPRASHSSLCEDDQKPPCQGKASFRLADPMISGGEKVSNPSSQRPATVARDMTVAYYVEKGLGEMNEGQDAVQEHANAMKYHGFPDCKDCSYTKAKISYCSDSRQPRSEAATSTLDETIKLVESPPDDLGTTSKRVKNASVDEDENLIDHKVCDNDAILTSETPIRQQECEENKIPDFRHISRSLRRVTDIMRDFLTSLECVEKADDLSCLRKIQADNIKEWTGTLIDFQQDLRSTSEYLQNVRCSDSRGGDEQLKGSPSQSELCTKDCPHPGPSSNINDTGAENSGGGQLWETEPATDIRPRAMPSYFNEVDQTESRPRATTSSQTLSTGPVIMTRYHMTGLT